MPPTEKHENTDRQWENRISTNDNSTTNQSISKPKIPMESSGDAALTATVTVIEYLQSKPQSGKEHNNQPM